jgi:histidinol phosphatase-like enzyme (inositol monophosphatase family)
MSPRLALAVEIAIEAGRHTLKYFRRAELQVDRKADQSPVTVADREAELLLRERIAAAFPDDAILGEEFPERAGTSGYRWILDPIDGTKSFIHGVPLYGTLVGIEQEGRSLAGAINIPACDEMVFAEKGGGAWYRAGNEQTRRAKVSSHRALAEGLFVTSEVANFAGRGSASAYSLLERAAGLSRTWGDCFGYLLVATGRALVMVDPIMNVWDAAAVQPIIEEAGGRFTDWKGEATIHHGEGIATNGLVHEEVLRLLRE